MLDLGCGECHIKLEFEKSFKRIVLVSAKHYVGRFAIYKGKNVAGTKIEIKGLEYKRGDTMRFARMMQKGLIDMLLGDELPTIEQVREFVVTWKQRILQGDLAIEDIVLSQSVKGLDEYATRYTSAKCTGGASKKKCAYSFASTEVSKNAPAKCPKCGKERKRAEPPVHVRIAKVLAARGEEIRAGTRIEYLIVSDEGDRIEAVPARDPGALQLIDRQYYWHTRIYPATARVLESAFPTEQWTETTQQKRVRRKEARVVHGTVGLPLFERVDPNASVVITLDRELDAPVDLGALKSLLLAHRGERSVMLRFVGEADTAVLNLVRYPVDASDKVLAKIEEVCGPGSVSLSLATATRN
jgi:predicted Zn-ribbon and HTH transcriptional regulator